MFQYTFKWDETPGKLISDAFFFSIYYDIALTGRVTGLNTVDEDATEPIQVVNYGTGGHYEPHVDYFGPMVDAYQGDRVATMLYYLSEHILGGK